MTCPRIVLIMAGLAAGAGLCAAVLILLALGQSAVRTWTSPAAVAAVEPMGYNDIFAWPGPPVGAPLGIKLEEPRMFGRYNVHWPFGWASEMARAYREERGWTKDKTDP